ncbi:gluconokinase [Paenibacillus sp. Leaf72]|uniref:gluconokinase n=1 Tax=Paenibacillus sp. Leaf72 TaxID=1736234 RepID=UPI0006FE94CB|nr:gluconokinase [Paenibacillus sp. Leaf72]KQO01120.1 gluconokinase [Paenibacillus sp. Leaf72]
MGRELVIGLDLGTTSVKACIFDRNGHLVADVEKMNTFYYPQQGWAEQSPVEIERSAVLAIREAIEKAKVEEGELLALGFSAAMHAILTLDAAGNPTSPAIIWADGRSAGQAEALLEASGEQVYKATGTPIHPMTPLMKLLWMKENNYEPYEQASYFMSIKEYLLYCWFGQRKIDYAMASATGLFNPAKLDWEPELLALTGISAAQLSEIVPPTEILSGLNADIAAQMGVSRDLPFAIGSADGQLSNLGIGAILPGEVAVSVGTSGAIRQLTHQAKVSDSRETFCYSFTKDTYIVGGPTNNGGIALQWLKDTLNYEGGYEAFLAEAEKIAPGADGLLFLPYLNGERAPLWNQRAKGNFYGLTMTHERAHLIRAVLEGVTFNLYQIGKALEKLAGAPQKMYVNGGLSRSPLWLQMMADIFDAEIYVSENHHSAAWGAAWTSLVATGYASSYEEIKQHIPMDKPVVPNPEMSKRYKEIYANYEKLAKTMAAFF